MKSIPHQCPDYNEEWLSESIHMSVTDANQENEIKIEMIQIDDRGRNFIGMFNYCPFCGKSPHEIIAAKRILIEWIMLDKQKS